MREINLKELINKHAQFYSPILGECVLVETKELDGEMYYVFKALEKIKGAYTYAFFKNSGAFVNTHTWVESRDPLIDVLFYRDI